MMTFPRLYAGVMNPIQSLSPTLLSALLLSPIRPSGSVILIVWFSSSTSVIKASTAGMKTSSPAGVSTIKRALGVEVSRADTVPITLPVSASTIEYPARSSSSSSSSSSRSRNGASLLFSAKIVLLTNVFASCSFSIPSIAIKRKFSLLDVSR